MKFYKGDIIQHKYCGDNIVAEVVGFYADGQPLLKTLKSPYNNVYATVTRFSHSCGTDDIALITPSSDRVKNDEYFKERGFFQRLMYLFTGKMP